jgi:hypothetical protein
VSRTATPPACEVIWGPAIRHRMADPNTDLLARIASLEAQVRDLLLRIASLEAIVKNSPRSEHPLDRDTVREKVSYDWQK